MLGFGGGGKDKALMSRVGAREKMKQARNIMGGGAPDKDAKRTPPAVAVITIFVMSVALAVVVTESYINQGGLRFSVGDAGLDKLLFKPGTHSFMGDPDMDYIILMLIRGFAIFVAAGIWPFATLVVQRALDNAHLNLYRAFWGTPIGLTLLFLLLKDYFGPMLAEVFKLMT